jgi:hypothetical protein
MFLQMNVQLQIIGNDFSGYVACALPFSAEVSVATFNEYFSNWSRKAWWAAV